MNGAGDNEQFVSRADFARLRGWNRSYVTKLAQQGRLVLTADGKRVDVQATIARLDESSDPGKTYVAQRHEADRVEKHVSALVRPDAPTDDAQLPEARTSAPSEDSGYWKSKGQREATLAKLAEVELQTKLGHLVERAKVEQVVESLHRMLRDSIMGLPTRLAPEIAPMTDAFEVERRMREAIRSTLDDLSKLTAQDISAPQGSAH